MKLIARVEQVFDTKGPEVMREKVFRGGGSKKVLGARHRDLTRMRSMELYNVLLYPGLVSLVPEIRESTRFEPSAE
jgi:hypothetical protein